VRICSNPSCKAEVEGHGLCSQCGASPYYNPKGWTSEDIRIFLDNIPKYQITLNKDGTCWICSTPCLTFPYGDKIWHECPHCGRYWDDYWTDAWLLAIKLEKLEAYFKRLREWKSKEA